MSIFVHGAVVAFACLLACVSSAVESDGKSYWLQQGQESLQRALGLVPNTKVAKNAILFLGDGMGVSTVTAARIYKGQKEERPGEDSQLTFERFPYVALSKTYNVDKQTADSAATATAFLCGAKANYATVGVDSRVTRANCSLMTSADVITSSILEWAHAAGKSVGIVTNTRITHATPAAAYAHSPDRNWETDWDIPAECPHVVDIAYQMLKNSSHMQVMLGGGRKEFYGRKDNRSLPEEWLTERRELGLNAQYVRNASEFRAVASSEVDQLLGLFAESHMEFELLRDKEKEPSIPEMTQKAIEILSKNSKGFFLLVEGGRIDHGHHQNWAKRALEETVVFDEAIETALNMTGDDTLMVVTADHSHVFNIAGYPSRGNEILATVDHVDEEWGPLDGKPYTTLVYGNGPGPDRSMDLTGVNTAADDFRFPTAVRMPNDSETHGGEDVGVYAQGPMAHLLHGTHEQNYIAHVMAYALCVGPNLAHCDGQGQTTTVDPGCTSGAAAGGGGGRGGGRRGIELVMVALVVGLFSGFVSVFL